MIRMIAWVAVIGICLSAPKALPTPLGEDQSPSVEKLIAQLGSKEFAERERATQLLKAKGVSALPALKKAANLPDQEVCRRIDELIPPLEIAVALSPKRVTLDAEKRSLAGALKEIEKQTGIKVELDVKADGNLRSFAMRDVPFWEALDRIGRTTGCVLSVVPGADETELSLKPCERRSPYLTFEGAFRVELAKLHEDRDLDFTEHDADKEPGRRDEELTATMRVLAEPRFLVLNIGQPRLEAAFDEDLMPLRWHRGALAREREATILRRLIHHSTELRFQRSTDESRMIKTLRGAVPVDVVVDRNPKVVTEALGESKGTKFKIGGENCEITRAEFNESGQFQVDIAVPPDLQDRLPMWHERIHLEDANGNRCHPTGRGSMSNGTEHWITLRFALDREPKAGPPSKMIVEDWVVVHHQIGFEFKDVPLP